MNHPVIPLVPHGMPPLLTQEGDGFGTWLFSNHPVISLVPHEMPPLLKQGGEMFATLKMKVDLQQFRKIQLSVGSGGVDKPAAFTDQGAGFVLADKGIIVGGHQDCLPGTVQRLKESQYLL